MPAQPQDSIPGSPVQGLATCCSGNLGLKAIYAHDRAPHSEFLITGPLVMKGVHHIHTSGEKVYSRTLSERGEFH